MFSRPHSTVFASTYIERVYERPEKVAESLKERVPVEFDTLVGTGLSGALIVPAIARILDKQWLIVRKPNDGTHSHQFAEGSLGYRWLFVDDLIDTGDTVKRVLQAVKHACKERELSVEFVGAYLYGGCPRYDDCDHILETLED